MAEVRLENVCKHFDEVVAVDDFNLSIRDKEFVVLVGPSGCGKTTTLRMIAGLESITSGDVYIGDRLINRLPAKDRNIAMVFQNYALYPHMTVFDNMAFSLEMRKRSKEEIKDRGREPGLKQENGSGPGGGSPEEGRSWRIPRRPEPGGVEPPLPPLRLADPAHTPSSQAATSNNV